MTKRRSIRRRKQQVEDYDEVEDLEAGDEAEEIVEEEPAPKRSRRRRTPRVVDDEPEEDEGDGEDPGEDEFEGDDDDCNDAPAPAKSKKSAKKPAKKPAKKTPTEPKVVEVKKVDDQVAEGVFSELLEAMAEGQAIIAVRLPGNKWQFVTGDVPTVGGTGGVRLKGKEYTDEVQTEEYREFIVEWSDLTYQEKAKKAKKLKVTWETHKDKRVDNIRLMLAVRDHLGIEKYKPDYINKSARDRLKGK